MPEKILDRYESLEHDVWDWSPDGSSLLLAIQQAGRVSVAILDLKTKKMTDFLADPGRDLFQAHFSNNGQWVTFNATGNMYSQAYIAPFRKAPVSRTDWIAVTDGSTWDDKPHFSHDDKLVFFTSDRDGFRCVWAQRLTLGMHLSGSPFPVYHAHQSRRSLGNSTLGGLELGVGPRILVFNQVESTGNIWLLESKNSGTE
jgi:Tol biopolymer transport system component